MRKVRVQFGRWALGFGVLACVACGAGADGAPGPDGKAGAAGAAGADGKAPASTGGSIRLVEPRAAVLAGEVEVTVSVDGLALDPASTVSFGAGVKVSQVALVGKHALHAVLTIDEAAALGPRDVVLTSGEAKLTATQGFQVAASLGVTVSGGKAEQGGLVQLDLKNNDVEWFDPENFEVYGQLSAADGAFVPVFTDYLGPRDGRVVMLADPALRVGPMALEGSNFPGDPKAPVYLSGPGALTVAARAPEALAATELTKVLSQPFATSLLKYTTAANKLNVVSVVPNGTLKPLVLGMGKLGKLSNLISQASTQIYPTTEAGSGTLIVANSTFEGGADAAKFGFKVSALSIDAEAPFAEPTTKHDGSDATAFADWGVAPAAPGAATPVRLLSGELLAADTADVYRLGPFPAGAVNLEVSAFSDAPITIAVSEAITFPTGAANTTSVALGYSAGFFGPQENGAKLAHGARSSAGTYRFVRVTPLNSKRGKYTLAARRLP